MIDQNDIEIIKNITEEFFQKVTIIPLSINVAKTITEDMEEKNNNDEKINEIINLDIVSEEPQILIGEKGQTLFEIQRLLRAILTKKIQKIFYLNLDINKYKQNKIDYLKKISKEIADEVSLTKEERVLSPMPAYERRIIHAEIMQRPDVATESRGEGINRRIVIKPR
ncbi:MAG: hypothetical protein HY005_02250 [Candidatus Staskawiczbacteria bacterium]|nr:hypothetical protein [Candidatus Staskawiczbacteria bacterium]